MKEAKEMPWNVDMAGDGLGNSFVVYSNFETQEVTYHFNLDKVDHVLDPRETRYRIQARLKD